MTATTATLVEDLTKRLAKATRNLEYAHEAIAAKVAAGTDAKTLGGLVNDLARLEGEANAWAHMLNAASHEADVTGLQVRMMEMLAQGADDSWSGRGNDVQRSRFDGLRTVADKVRWL